MALSLKNNQKEHNMNNHNDNPAVPTAVTAHIDYNGNVIYTVNPKEARIEVKDHNGNIINVSINHYGE